MNLLAPVAAETAATNTGPIPIPPATDKRIPWWVHALILTPGVVAAGGLIYAIGGM